MQEINKKDFFSALEKLAEYIENDYLQCKTITDLSSANYVFYEKLRSIFFVLTYNEFVKDIRYFTQKDSGLIHFSTETLILLATQQVLPHFSAINGQTFIEIEDEIINEYHKSTYDGEIVLNINIEGKKQLTTFLQNGVPKTVEIYTNTRHRTKNPLYDENFTMELMEILPEYAEYYEELDKAAKELLNIKQQTAIQEQATITHNPRTIKKEEADKLYIKEQAAGLHALFPTLTSDEARSNFADKLGLTKSGAGTLKTAFNTIINEYKPKKEYYGLRYNIDYYKTRMSGTLSKFGEIMIVKSKKGRPRKSTK